MSPAGTVCLSELRGSPEFQAASGHPRTWQMVLRLRRSVSWPFRQPSSPSGEVWCLGLPRYGKVFVVLTKCSLGLPFLDSVPGVLRGKGSPMSPLKKTGHVKSAFHSCPPIKGVCVPSKPEKWSLLPL